jgi:hypothetical protein
VAQLRRCNDGEFIQRRTHGLADAFRAVASCRGPVPPQRSGRDEASQVPTFPSCVMWPLTPGRATDPRITGPPILSSAGMNASAPATLFHFRFNPTPHKIAVYASP